MPAAELLQHATPIVGFVFNKLLQLEIGGKRRGFMVTDDAWEKLQDIFLGYGEEAVSQQLKLRAKTAAILAPWAVGAVVLSWQSFAVPIGILLGLQWVAARYLVRASSLIAVSTFLLFGAAGDAFFKYSLSLEGPWIQWVLPTFMTLMALGHWRAYRWLTRTTSPSAVELAGAVLVGLLALAAVTAWGYAYCGLDIWLWMIAPEWMPEPSFLLESRLANQGETPLAW